MARFIIKKIALHLSVGAALCLLIGYFSIEGRLYAGYAAAFLGAVYLLTGWMRWLKASGTDLLSRFRRSGPPQAPDVHRRDKSERPGILAAKGRFPHGDSLEEEQESPLPKPLQLKGEALAYALCGAVLLAVSLLV